MELFNDKLQECERFYKFHRPDGGLQPPDPLRNVGNVQSLPFRATPLRLRSGERTRQRSEPLYSTCAPLVPAPCRGVAGAQCSWGYLPATIHVQAQGIRFPRSRGPHNCAAV